MCAQLGASQSSNSAYSSFYLGDLTKKGFGPQNGMAYTGIGLRSNYYVNVTNPAAVNSISKPISHIFDIGLGLALKNSSQGNVSHQVLEGNLKNINLWFRFSDHWAGSVGFEPYSQVNYSILKSSVSLGDEEEYSINYSGNGGINKFYLVQAFSLSEKLSLGINTHLLFGNIYKSQQVYSQNSSYNVISDEEIGIISANLNLGLQYVEGNHTFGLVFNPKKQISATYSSYLYQLDGDTLDSDIDNKTNYSIPLGLGAGYSYRFDRFTLAADGTFDHWQGLDDQKESSPNNQYAISLGLISEPKFFAKKISLPGWQLGLGYRQTYHHIENSKLYEYYGTAGLDIPLQGIKGSMGLFYEYNLRNSFDSSFIREATHHITLNLSIRDVWFNKHKIN